MGYICILKILGCIIIAYMLVILKNKGCGICKINLVRLFDRSYSTKTTNQLIWLLFILLVTFVVMLIIALFIYNGNPFVDAESNFDKNSSYYLLEYVSAIMLDPGQIDHVKSGPEHTWSMLLGLIGVIAVTGITISTITNIVQRRVNQYLNGEVE